jgi:hypothetical protein
MAPSQFHRGSPGERPGSLTAPGGLPLARAKLAADLNTDPQAAADQYAAIVSRFDDQREDAAQAIFGLAEAYRRLKRFTEARVQYARILREFVDFPELARQSQQQLISTNVSSGEDPNVSMNVLNYRAPAADSNAIPTDLETQHEHKNLLLEELKLLEQELASTKNRVQMGLESSASSLPLQRDILRLKQQLLRFPKEDRLPAPAPVRR